MTALSRKLVIDADTGWLADFRREHGERHLLGMSRGKDALACWLVLRELGIEVVPYHLSVVPGLEFVLEDLARLERIFGTSIIDMPHRSFWRMIDSCTLQPPERVAIIETMDPRVPEYAQIYGDVRKLSGAPAGCMVASGVRACDSIQRRLSFQRSGWIRPRTETFYPCWNFNIAAVREILDRHALALPVDYEMFGRSFDGIDGRFLLPIKQRFPRDFARILEWFPLAELEVWRYERTRST